MTHIEIENPHGYLLDADGKVVQKFGNWQPGETVVDENVASVEYVDGPDAHTKDVADEYKTNLTQ